MKRQGDTENSFDFANFWEGEPTDEELEQTGIVIPETETDQSFFDRIDQIIREVMEEEI